LIRESSGSLGYVRKSHNNIMKKTGESILDQSKQSKIEYSQFDNKPVFIKDQSRKDIESYDKLPMIKNSEFEPSRALSTMGLRENDKSKSVMSVKKPLI
jgi:hypothetical protein